MLKKLCEFIRHIIDRVCHTKVTDAAAAITYYSLLSFFPFILLLIALNSAFLQSVEAQTKVIQWIQQYLPASDQIIMGNIQHLIKASETVGYVGIVMLIWSATLVFAGFAQNLNLAWEEAQSRHFLKDRFIGLLMIGAMFIILGILLLTNTVIDAIPRLYPGFLASLVVKANRFQSLFIEILPVFSIFVMLTLLYKHIPNCLVLWREAIVASAFSGISMLITKQGFVWYITRGPNSYALIYGSLGTIVAFMLWVYLSSCIILIGGHVSAACAHFFRTPKEIEEEKAEEKNSLPLAN